MISGTSAEACSIASNPFDASATVAYRRYSRHFPRVLVVLDHQYERLLFASVAMEPLSSWTYRFRSFSGSFSVNVEPLPGSLRSSIAPSNVAARRRQIDKPDPCHLPARGGTVQLTEVLEDAHLVCLGDARVSFTAIVIVRPGAGSRRSPSPSPDG